MIRLGRISGFVIRCHGGRGRRGRGDVYTRHWLSVKTGEAERRLDGDSWMLRCRTKRLRWKWEKGRLLDGVHPLQEVVFVFLFYHGFMTKLHTRLTLSNDRKTNHE